MLRTPKDCMGRLLVGEIAFDEAQDVANACISKWIRGQPKGGSAVWRSKDLHGDMGNPDLKELAMCRKALVLAILSVAVLSLAGCCSMTARNPYWRDNYDPPYVGVKHAVYSVATRDPFAELCLIDLPATLVVDTCLLPLDFITMLGETGETGDTP